MATRPVYGQFNDPLYPANGHAYNALYETFSPHTHSNYVPGALRQEQPDKGV